jgi:Zn-dependent metalloprotease
MSTSLDKIHYHVNEDPRLPDDATSRGPDSFRHFGPAGIDADVPAPRFTSYEGAARYYLDQLLTAERPGMTSVIEPERPELVPGLVVEREQDLAVLGTHSVRLAQTHNRIPVFGAGAVVEVTGDRDLISVTAALGEVADVDPVESLSRADAVQRVATYTGTDLGAAAGEGARLNYYQDETSEQWHLAWFLPDLPAEPPYDVDAADDADLDLALDGHGLGPRPVPARYHYLVDAHDGAILFHYSAMPTALGTPARCTGIDENEDNQTFFGRLVSEGGTACELDDPLRDVRTFDLEFADLDTDPPTPAKTVGAATGDFGTSNRAAVSAHLNASRVQDFYKVVLQRDGIDDQGMTLVSLVNVTAASMQAPPALLNAFWWQKRMWYGQIERDGRLVSLSKYLDVIAHELTHGVIETTSDLVYQTQSGALNESFADIAGVIINNWYTAPDRHDVGTWTWEIGPGLRPDGRPLRDFADPARLGHPAHMDQFRALKPGEIPSQGNDQGWVHVNSNIHNKAVHHLLTMTQAGDRVFTVEDVAVLTYLGMARLPSRATFADALQGVVDVAETYFGGRLDRKDKVSAVREAYGSVGIT